MSFLLFGFQWAFFLSLTSFVVKLVRQSILFQIKCLRRLTTFQSMSYILLGSSGLEPPTSRLSGARSNQLSYEPVGCASVWIRVSDVIRLEMMGFEPMTPCLQGRCSPNWATPPCDPDLFIAFNELQSSLTENWTTICTLCTPIRRPSCNAVCSSP